MVPKSLEEYLIRKLHKTLIFKKKLNINVSSSPELANGTPDPIQDILDSAGPGPSMCLNLNDPLSSVDDLVETQLDEENSRQSSSFNPLSPSAPEFTDEEGDSDLSSDDLN